MRVNLSHVPHGSKKKHFCVQITDLHALIGISLWFYSTHISISIVQIVYGGDFQATRAMIITWLDATTWPCSSNVRFHYLIGIKLVTWHILYHCAVFSGEKTPRACRAVWLSLRVHQGHPIEIDQKVGTFLPKLVPWNIFLTIYISLSSRQLLKNFVCSIIHETQL